RRVLRPAPRPMHKVRRLAGLLGLAEPPAPRLWTTPAQDDQAATLLPGDGPVLALGPTANWVGKQWPGERFAELACRLTAAEGILPGARIAVFGAPHERDLARQALDGLPAERRIDLVGRVDLPTLYACLRRCRLFIGNDSGLMHMAAAAGIPTLGLFGPSRDEIYGPWSPLAAVVRTERSFEDIVHDPGFDHRSGACHMLDLSVERAEAATLALWRRVAAEAA
ncbi:MAG TPA: glycosyltransferase family 9 protein, partial [Alphaproteobacteria bacterium]|nr:glycosyltransferase family 9 protein [Alphaproteobacteria bacterium]